MQENLGKVRWEQYVQGMRRVKHSGLLYQYVQSVIDCGIIYMEVTLFSKNEAESLKTILGNILHDFHLQFVVLQWPMDQ